MRCAGSETAAPGAKGTLALRPEKVAIGRELQAADCVNRYHGKVFDYLYTGDVTLYIIERMKRR
ncbi:TOBE domain-containing protein [Mycobacterium tuberculosis]|uniref:TOBE domain-containing protein n=1 Tax=Mycobacterium tuberculosis TaxID=1773 RepID=UPI00272C8FCB|nr:TOBE domain-containing protein [Mycobacterium tuberculosis]